MINNEILKVYIKPNNTIEKAGTTFWLLKLLTCIASCSVATVSWHGVVWLSVCSSVCLCHDCDHTKVTKLIELPFVFEEPFIRCEYIHMGATWQTWLNDPAQRQCVLSLSLLYQLVIMLPVLSGWVLVMVEV